MLDLIFLTLTLALFALVGLVAKGVEKLSPRTSGSGRLDAAPREERS